MWNWLNFRLLKPLGTTFLIASEARDDDSRVANFVNKSVRMQMEEMKFSINIVQLAYDIVMCAVLFCWATSAIPIIRIYSMNQKETSNTAYYY